MSAPTFKEANRRHFRAFLPVMGFYSVFCFAGPEILKMVGDPPRWASAAVALISAAPLVAVFWLMGRFLRETDEYTRMVQTRAMLAGGATLLSFGAVWGFLELFGLVPHLKPVLLVPFFFASYGAASFLRWLRDRSCGGTGNEGDHGSGGF